MHPIDRATVALAYTTGTPTTADATVGDRQPAASGMPAVAPTTDRSQPAPDRAAADADPASMNLESLAAAVGMDPDELLAQVKSGQGLGDVLGQTGQLGYGSTVRDAIRGGIVIDQYA